MPPSEEILRALAVRGLLAPDPAFVRLPGGNMDRKPEFARTPWRAVSKDGSLLKLTIGRDLSTLAERHKAIAEACPTIVPPAVFHERVEDFDVFAEAFVDGVDTSDLPSLRTGVASVRAALASSERPSTAAARANEWRRFSKRLLDSGAFDEGESNVLRESILPALLPRLSGERASTRWSNGDFRTGNILVDTADRGWLIDHEHAERTHFFREDEVRFTVFSPEARRHPDILPSTVAHDPAWHLYFWLRQFLLETENNTPGYAARFGMQRKAHLRLLAQNLLGAGLAGWSAPATPVDFMLEDVRWLQHEEMTLFVSGWCHVPVHGGLEAILLSPGGSTPLRLERTARPDVEAHFGVSVPNHVSGFRGQDFCADPVMPFTLSALTAEGALLPLRTFHPSEFASRGPSTGHYVHWALRHDPDPVASACVEGPFFSILLPVYNTPPAFLEACLTSVAAQHYPRWEAIVIDDSSTSPDIAPVLNRFADDPRFVVARRSENGGIARATNDALSRSRGDFVVLLDHDDILRPHALAALANALAEDPTLDVLYSDEDKIDEGGRRLFPFFKPAFSPEFLRGVMYPGHVLCLRRILAVEIGGFDPAFDGVQDYEFFLRLSERTGHVRHLPVVLYHWRRSAGSSALHGNIKGDMDARQLAAVRAHLERIGDSRLPEALGGHRIRLRAAPDAPDVSIDILHAEAPPLEVLAAAARARTADMLVLVCEHPSATTDGWERELTTLAARPDSAFVAPLLISGEGRVLESGCTFADDRLAPLMTNFCPDDDGYNGATLCNREVAAVSPLCVAVRRSLLLAYPPLPGADWVSYSESLRKAGFLNRVCATARVALSRSGADHRHTLAVPPGAEDPYYNPAFRRSPGDYAFEPSAKPRPLSVRTFFSHLDLSPAATIADGCLVVRGWCFHDRAIPVRIEIQAGPIVWSTSATQPRPDVATAFMRPEIAACGFSFQLRLPAGRHVVILTAFAESGPPEIVHQTETTVPVTAPWRRALNADPTSLLACQLPATPLHAPKSPRPRSSRSQTPANHAWPGFSIVTPSYGQAWFLEETLRSVLSQPVAGEYFVQDGASKDGSVEILQNLAEEHASQSQGSAALNFAWESGPDFGQTDAIAKGFEKTHGRPEDIMAWLNADDLYLPGALATVARYFARHPDVDVVYGHRLLIDDQSREIGRWRLPPHDPEVLRLYDFVPQETLFWRRRVWDRVGGVDRDYQFAMDWDLLLRFQEAGARIARLPHFLACFRVHAMQKTSSQLASIGQEELDTLRHRTFGRLPAPEELITHPRLQAYLRASARLDLLASLGLARQDSH